MIRYLLLAVSLVCLSGCYATLDERDAALDAFCPDGHCPIVKAARAIQPNPTSNTGPAFEPWEIQP